MGTTLIQGSPTSLWCGLGFGGVAVLLQFSVIQCSSFEAQGKPVLATPPHPNPQPQPPPTPTHPHPTHPSTTQTHNPHPRADPHWTKPPATTHSWFLLLRAPMPGHWWASGQWLFLVFGEGGHDWALRLKWPMAGHGPPVALYWAMVAEEAGDTQAGLGGCGWPCE